MQLFYPLAKSIENIGIHKYLDTTKSQSYIPITGCILSHILSSKELSSLEKIYYILADSLSCINFNKGRNRSISLPAKSWAERLSCSKSEVFVLQKSLEDKGYFLIHRDKNDIGQNNRNIITTTIPDKVFKDLKYEPDRFDLCDVNDAITHQNNSNSLDSTDKTFIPTLEGKRQHLEKTKMFIRVPYQFLKQLNSNCSISATSKVIMLYHFTKIYKSSANKYDYDDPDIALTHNSYSIVTSYQELQKELKLHRNTLARALKDLEDNNLIKRDQLVIKSNDDYNSRADKSLWRISLLNVPTITNHNNQHEQETQEEQINQQQIVKSRTSTKKHTYNQANNIGVNQVLESPKERECTKYDPVCTDSGQLYNKDLILKNSIIKNIDYIDANYLDSKNLSINNSSVNLQSQKTVKKEFFGNEQSSFPSESYKNSSFLNDSYADSTGTQQTHSDISNIKQSCFNTSSENTSRTIKDISVKEIWGIKSVGQKPKTDTKSTIKNIELQKELRHFYPLSEKDVSTLNFKTGREFSVNFVNQLLLKLYIKYPEKRFKNKFTFLSYMEKILKNEKHQGPLVNHTTFRFSCNINAEEKDMLEYEKYLSEIEHSLNTSKEMQVRKKIAGRFSTEVAHSILTQVEFKISLNDSFITALIPSQLDLSERQIVILSEQLEAVYGSSGYYVTVVENVGYDEDGRSKGDGEEEKERLYPKTTTSDIVPNNTPVGIVTSSRGLEIQPKQIQHGTTSEKD